jgi:hypothetical protein
MSRYIGMNVLLDRSGCLHRPLQDTGSMPSPKAVHINYITLSCNLEN